MDEGFLVFLCLPMVSSNASACSNADRAACCGVSLSTSRLIMIACMTITAMVSLLVKKVLIEFPFRLVGIV